jgi:glutamate dehydrogenase
MKKAFNSYEMAQAQFDKIAERLDLDNGTRDLLRGPMREVRFRMPIRMDDGRVRVFQGFRILHNNARGPGKGGVRFHPAVTIDTLRALAMWMTWKSALMDIPLGGAAGGVVCDPHDLSWREQESISREWVHQLFRDLGPNVDVPAPEVMAYAQHMLWMLDEYESIKGEKQPGFITGKPVSMGGSLGRREAAGYGMVFVLREAMNELDIAVENTTISIQGFGNVAQYLAQLYHQMGGRVICVSCWDQHDGTSYAYTKKGGVDVESLATVTDRFGGIDKKGAQDLGYTVLPGGAWIEQEVDILVPAAIENQITMDNVEAIRPTVKIIAEGANGPATSDASNVIQDRGIFVIPDILANAGGVTCSYFEQVQSNMNYYWSKEEVLGKLDMTMTTAFHTVLKMAKEKQIDMHDAAFYIAIDRVVQACRDRGWV